MEDCGLLPEGEQCESDAALNNTALFFLCSLVLKAAEIDVCVPVCKWGKLLNSHHGG